MGDKSTARETMKQAGVPTVPGSDGLLKVYVLTLGINQVATWIFLLNNIFLQSTEEGIKLADEIGYPVMIKVNGLNSISW